MTTDHPMTNEPTPAPHGEPPTTAAEQMAAAGRAFSRLADFARKHADPELAWSVARDCETVAATLVAEPTPAARPPGPGWTSFERQTRAQAIATCHALLDQRDRALRRAERAEAVGAPVAADSSDVERLFDAWAADLIAHHGDRIVREVLSSPAIQAAFIGDVHQSLASSPVPSVDTIAAVNEVTLPRWAADLLASPSPRRCGVCMGLSPGGDGHQLDPPCIGAARDALRGALLGLREGA